MPSLNDLGQFKFSFANIANEKADRAERNIPYPDLPLPETEAAPMDIPLGNPDASDSAEVGGFDMSAFLDSLPQGDITPPPLDDVPVVPEFSAMDDLLGSLGNAPAADTSYEEPAADEPSETEFPTDNFDLPADEPTADDLLGGLDLASSAELPADEPSETEFPADDLLSGFDLAAAEELSEEEPSTEELLSDFDIPVAEEMPAEEMPIDEPAGIDLGGESLENLPEDTPAADDSFGDFDLPVADEMPAEDNESFDLGGIDLGGESLADDDALSEPGEPQSEELPATDSESFDLGGIDLGGESLEDLPEDTPAADDSFGDFDLPISDDFSEEAPPADGMPTEETPETGSGDFDLGNFDLGGDTSDGDSFADETGTEDFPLNDESFDFGGETGTASSEEVPDAAPIDLGDFGSDFASESIDLGSEFNSGEMDSASDSDFGSGDFGGESLGSDDFALDGLDELFEKTKVAPVAPPPKKSLFGGLKKKKTSEEDLPEPESDIEEIRLTEADVDKLMNTIASYPLNLRIACEELIAEQVILPQQLSRLLRCLINNVNIRETAALVEEITGKPVIIPKSYEKMTGAAFEAEQASFAYIFVHNFLPVFRLVAIIAAFIASVAYLGYRFIYIPIHAEGLYKRGYEQIAEGEYQRANELFDRAFNLHRKKKWFYLYAERFRDVRRYMLAEEKYDKLLFYYPRDKKGVLDYAHLNTYYILNYEKANRLLQQQLLDYNPNDYEGLLAAGDNFLLWADSDPENNYDRYNDALFCYSRLLELRGWQVPIVERLLKHWIRTDNLKEVLHLRHWFESDDRRRLTTETLAELAGYLLDKQFEEVRGVPDPYLEGIYSVRNMLLQAITENPYLPEPHYHLARYHHGLNNPHEERLTLENAIRAFDIVENDPQQTETVRRRQYRVDTHYRYSNVLLRAREFFPAEENVVRGITLYEDYLSRNLIRATARLPFSNIPQLGQLYAAKGDLEYFVKSGNMQAALNDYHTAERYGYSPPEIQYRIGAAYYQLEDWRNALDYLFRSSADLPLNRRMLYALGNAAYRRNDYFAAQGYYTRLLEILENQRVRLPVTLPNDNPQFLELGERMMIAYNNIGVVYEALANQTGNREYRSRALFYYMESARAWDSITRNPQTMTRMSLVDTPGAPSVNQGYLNVQNATRPGTDYIPQIFPRIDKDVVEPSMWEQLAGAASLQ